MPASQSPRLLRAADRSFGKYTVFPFLCRTVFLPLSVKFGFLDEVESQCEDALEKGMISETEAELILDVAVAIEEGTDVPEAEEEKHVSQTVQEMKENNYTYYHVPRFAALLWRLHKPRFPKKRSRAERYAFFSEKRRNLSKSAGFHYADGGG